MNCTMKKYKLIAVFLLLGCLCSCTKFLDLPAKNERAVQSLDDIKSVLAGYLYGQATGKPVLDAAFVALGEDGGERPLFGKAMTIEERERALSLIPRLIGFILLHMELCPEFRPREGAHCRWCSWRNVCIISSQQ